MAPFEFAAGEADWGTLIALEVDGEVVIGFCDQPAHRRRYWACRGHGAFKTLAESARPTILRVSAHANLRGARSYIPPPQWLPDDRARAVAGALREATTPLPHHDHPALQVAFGDYELLVFLIAGPWDLAAPSLIVEEAGGRFSDLHGRHRLTSGNALFSNGLVHENAVQHVAPLVGDASHCSGMESSEAKPRT
jgi:histidinol-phosphatase